MLKTNKIMKNWYKFLNEEVRFANSKDVDMPGNKQYVCFKEDEIYSNKTDDLFHGKMSHAIKHFSEFEPEKSKSFLKKAIDVVNQSENVFLKSATNDEMIASGEKAKKQINFNSMLNTFDMINDKKLNNEKLLPQELQILKILDAYTKEYEDILESQIGKAVDVDNIKDENEIKKLIDSGKILKFTGDFQGKEFTYYLNTTNSGLAVSDKNDVFSTFFRFDKKGNNFKKFPKGTNIKNDSLKAAMGLKESKINKKQRVALITNEQYIREVLREALALTPQTTEKGRDDKQILSTISQELPLTPSDQVANQLTSQRPPVEDPDYVPATPKELGKALDALSGLVPSNSVEKFYKHFINMIDNFSEGNEEDE